MFRQTLRHSPGYSCQHKAVTVDRKTDTGADSLTVVSRGANQTTLTVNDEETLTIDSSVAATTITTMNAADLSTLTITGDEGLTIATLAGNEGLTAVDAQAQPGAVSVGATANADITAATYAAGRVASLRTAVRRATRWLVVQALNRSMVTVERTTCPVPAEQMISTAVQGTTRYRVVPALTRLQLVPGWIASTVALVMTP